MQSILGNTRKMDITFNANGRIDVSSRVAKILCLTKGDVIDVMVCNMELYLYVKLHAPTVGRHEAVCFPTQTKSNHFRAWSKRLCRAMIHASGSKLSKVVLSVGATVELAGVGTALPIIYKNILNTDK